MPQKPEFNREMWEPKTELGKAVKEGRITSISQILSSGEKIREPEITDMLVPGLEEEIINVNLVQRMHKSGRRVKYKVVMVLGNRDGVVGIGQASAREITSSIRKATENAKMNVIEVARGCGSWECGCGRPHSVPFTVTGKSGSVKITIKPAPRGLGCAAAEIPRTILRFAGIKDAWTRSEGQTKSTLNFAMATLNALKETSRMAVNESIRGKIKVGMVGEEGA
ncbi:MAG: 30S ribosomal protein S5 [Candidatus Hadarchaeales archaeon]